MTRYVIIGAGAIGGAIGGRLVQAGQQAVLVARGDHLAAMRAGGLRLRTPEEDVTLDVQVADGPGEVSLRADDVLVISTKTQQMASVLSSWADAPVLSGKRVLGSAGTLLPVLTATNGVAAEELALRYFGRVFGICVWLPANLVGPGEVVAEGTPVSGVLHIGRVPAELASSADSELLKMIEADWTAADLGIRLPPAVMSWKYRKLISNLGNILQALLGPTREAEPLRAATEAEAREILDAAGVTYTSDEEEAAARSNGFEVKPVPGIEEFLGGSTWQSLRRGTGNVETDYLNGEIALLAHRLGRTAPINEGLARLGRQAAAAGRRPGDIAPAELARELGL